METLLDDLLHAQPDALLMIAGLVFLGIAIVGSVKTYFDPGRNGRIAAGAVGGILLLIGLFMYKPGPPPPSTSTVEAVSKSGTAPGAAANACYVPGKWPQLSNKQMTVGTACTNANGETGQAVIATQMCAYSEGPKSGTSEKLRHQMYVGSHCASEDKQSKGTAVAATGQ